MIDETLNRAQRHTHSFSTPDIGPCNCMRRMINILWIFKINIYLVFQPTNLPPWRTGNGVVRSGRSARGRRSRCRGHAYGRDVWDIGWGSASPGGNDGGHGSPGAKA